MILPVNNPDLTQGPIASDALARTRAFFGEDTPLKHAEEAGGRPYERREQQEQMSFAVAEALADRHNLLVEAPTGVGKSFAYLVPAIYHARAMRQCVLITTETINLQEQLVSKDLPILSELMDEDFTYVIAKGRSNYLCKRRLMMAGGEHREELIPADTAVTDIQQLLDWARTTETGSKSEIEFRLDPQLWTCVCSEASSCMGPKCKHFHSCFYWKARHTWDKADIVVTNHALFFTDLKIRAIEQQENCPLPQYCAVIFDEAHTLEDNAARHLGLQVHSGMIRAMLNRLFNPVNGRGLLMKPGSDSMSIRGEVSEVHEAMTGFFAQFDEPLDKSPDQIIRVTKPGKFEDSLSGKLDMLGRHLNEFIKAQEEAGLKIELEAQLERCNCTCTEIDQFIHMSLPDQVYWVEGRQSRFSRYSRQTELISAPLNIAQLLGNILFSSGKPVILTSATLAVRDSLTYFANRVGFHHGDGLILDTPFNYKHQVKLFVSRTMPQPNEQNYTEKAAEQIRTFVDKTNGNAFVLFTSFNMLNSCVSRLSNHFLAQGINLLVHGDTLSRSAMLSEFKKVKSSVIFGASSFWTGVDVPGDALSNVIITKLPFAVPNHPLIEARCDAIRKLGGEPFRDYSIPDAVLKFRQGIGRLIRSKTDTGIIVVLDPRIITKYYGRSFLESIPECPIEYF